ncbi:ATPase, partial [Streptomyces sp. 2MCAF27]
SAGDAYCGPDKAAALADAVLATVDRCRQLVDSGVPAATVEAVDFGPVLRAAEEVGPHDVAGVRERRQDMLARLGELG